MEMTYVIPTKHVLWLLTGLRSFWDYIDRSKITGPSRSCVRVEVLLRTFTTGSPMKYVGHCGWQILFFRRKAAGRAVFPYSGGFTALYEDLCRVKKAERPEKDRQIWRKASTLERANFVSCLGLHWRAPAKLPTCIPGMRSEMKSRWSICWSFYLRTLWVKPKAFLTCKAFGSLVDQVGRPT